MTPGRHAAVLRQWQRAPGSLSRLIAALGEGFEVRPLRQGPARLQRDEAAHLGAAPGARTWVREVLLCVAGEPLVWARSTTTTRALAGPWRALRGLGTRSLAELLYTDRGVTRSALRPQAVRANSPLQRRLHRQWADALVGDLPCGPLRARSSVFHRRGAPLRVLEVFSPVLGTRPPAHDPRAARRQRPTANPPSIKIPAKIVAPSQ